MRSEQAADTLAKNYPTMKEINHLWNWEASLKNSVIAERCRLSPAIITFHLV